MMNLSLQSKTALICGASQGIGKAIAHALAEQGANCILLARNEAALQTVVDGLQKIDAQKHSYAAVDFTDVDRLKQLVERLTAANAIDILINNTGGPAAGLIEQAEPISFELAFKQHLVCNHMLAQAVLPSMKKKGWGRIINIISTSVKIPINNLGVSNTIRAAVASWAKTLSNEVAVHGVTVNSLLPGFIATSRLDAVAEAFAQRDGVSKQDMIQQMINTVPAKRFGDPSEIAAVAAFVASPAASYLNGITIPVDGGRTGTI